MVEASIILFVMLFSLSSAFRAFHPQRKLLATSGTCVCSSSRSSSSATEAGSKDQEKGQWKPKRFIDFPFAYHEEMIVSIEDITNLGMGVARTKLKDGNEWVIMVPLVLPGERVQVRIYRNSKSYSEADLVKVIDPSDERVEPLCKYFSECGGCQYQHMSIETQREWKRKQVESLLQRIGKVESKKLDVNPTVGTDHLYGYRAKLTPHYNAPRSSQDLKIGFQRRGTRVMIDIDECIIGTKDINLRYMETRRTIYESIKGKEKGLGQMPKKGATLLFRKCDQGVETDQRTTVTHTLNGIKFSFVAGEFFQNNYYVLPIMVEHVLRMAQGDGCKVLIDAYCGSGLFALSAANHFESIYGIEVSEIATNAAKENAKLNSIQNVEFLCGDSKEIFKKVSHMRSDDTVLVIDPPRRGCDESFLEQLAEFKPKKLVYMSCDPATQARDAKFILSRGYIIVDITPFDLFPQTRHIENCITFMRL